MSKKHDVIHIDESDRGTCYYCGKPAAIKVAMWSDLSPTSEDTEQNWRAVLICRDCNDKHNLVDEQGLPDTYLGY